MERTRSRRGGGDGGFASEGGEAGQPVAVTPRCSASAAGSGTPGSPGRRIDLKAGAAAVGGGGEVGGGRGGGERRVKAAKGRGSTHCIPIRCRGEETGGGRAIGAGRPRSTLGKGRRWMGGGWRAHGGGGGGGGGAQ